MITDLQGKPKFYTCRYDVAFKEVFLNEKNEEMFFKVIKASFMQRRKTLINGLTNSGIIQDKKKLEQIIKQMNLNLEIRGEKLSLEQFAELSNIITESI